MAKQDRQCKDCTCFSCDFEGDCHCPLKDYVKVKPLDCDNYRKESIPEKYSETESTFGARRSSNIPILNRPNSTIRKFLKAVSNDIPVPTRIRGVE